MRLYMLMANNSRVMIAQYVKFEVSLKVIWGGLLCFILLLPEVSIADRLAEGKALVMERAKGNCLACHVIADGKLPGNIGPPLIGMTARFPETETLRNQIWDATERNPNSRMPPFGRHGILNSQDIDRIVDYLYTL